MIFDVNNLKMLFVWIVSIALLFIKKFDAKTKHQYPVIWLYIHLRILIDNVKESKL